MSKIDSFIMGRFDQVRKDPHYKPIIDQVKAATQNGPITSDEMMNVALNATVDQFKREGRKLDKNEIRKEAFTAADVAAMDAPFQLKDLPKGTDKSIHYLTSSLISMKVSGFFGHIMPQSWADKLGTGITSLIGIAKEGYDKISGGDCSKLDIAADEAGARKPYQVKIPTDKA